MGQTKFAQRAKAKDGFGLFGRAQHGPKDEPQGRGEHKTVGNGFGPPAAGPKDEPQGRGEHSLPE